MRTFIALASLWLLLASSAQALPADPKVLAQFDIGYAKCEQQFAHMRGHRDEAYLALWKVQADPKARGQLATLRQGKQYKQERQLALKSMAKSAGPQTEGKLKQQCEATWAETTRNAPAKP